MMTNVVLKGREVREPVGTGRASSVQTPLKILCGRDQQASATSRTWRVQKIDLFKFMWSTAADAHSIRQITMRVSCQHVVCVCYQLQLVASRHG